MRVRYCHQTIGILKGPRSLYSANRILRITRYRILMKPSTKSQIEFTFILVIFTRYNLCVTTKAVFVTFQAPKNRYATCCAVLKSFV